MEVWRSHTTRAPMDQRGILFSLPLPFSSTGEKKKQKDIYNPGNNVNGCIVWHSFVCYAKSFQCVRLFATPWTIAHQAPLPVGFSRQEYWSGFPFPPPWDLPDPGIKPWSLRLLYWQVGSLPLATIQLWGKKNSTPDIYLESNLAKRLCRKVFILGSQMAYTTIGWDEATNSMLGFQEWIPKSHAKLGF